MFRLLVVRARHRFVAIVEPHRPHGGGQPDHQVLAGLGDGVSRAAGAEACDGDDSPHAEQGGGVDGDVAGEGSAAAG